MNERLERGMSSGLHTLAASITGLVVTNSDNLPPTLTLDYVRLRTLQMQFQNLLYQAACRWTFEEILDSLSWRGVIPEHFYDDLFARISIITSDDETRCEISRRAQDVVLEIARKAYQLCNIQTVPSSTDLEFTASNLIHASDHSTVVFKDLERYLREDLDDIVQEEVEAIKELTPMQISNLYLPECSVQLCCTTHQTELLRVAQQISHMSVLHWRVWAPILYSQPEEPGDT